MRRLCAIAFLLAAAGCAMQGAPDLSGRRFVVFFQPWSAQLDDPATQAVRAAADEIRAQPGERLVVIGYADPTGTSQANDYISRARAQQVADALAADGVPPANISIHGAGETGFKLSPQESRRVEIVVTR